LEDKTSEEITKEREEMIEREKGKLDKLTKDFYQVHLKF
jgi:hypothetical protein